MKVALLAAILFVVSLAFAQDDVLVIKDQKPTEPQGQPEVIVPQAPAESSPDSTFFQLYDKWRDVQDALKQGNTTEAQSVLQQVVELHAKADIPRLTDFAMNAVQIGDQLLANNKVDDALKFYHAATELDPSLGYAFYSQSKGQWAQGISGYIPAMISAVRGLFAPASTLTGQIYFRSKWLLIFVITGVILGFVYSIILLVKYNRLLRHDAVEKYGAKKGAGLVELAVWVILFLPVLLFFGPLWLAPFWFMLFWGYCKTTERIISVVCFVIFLMAAPVYGYVAELSKATSDPMIAPYLRAYTEGGSPAVIQDLQHYTERHPEEQDASILLGYLLKTESNFDGAITVLQKHTIDHPNDARAFNNLGNIFFIQGETDSALHFLERAQEINNRNATVLFNLSKAYRAKFDFNTAESTLEQARLADSSLVRKLEGTTSEQLVDMIPEEETLWAKISSKEKSMVSLIANPFTILTIIFFGATFAMNLGKSKKQDYARKCLKCGKPFCRKCQTGSKTYDFCTPCLHIFVKKDGVSPASRKEKMQEIEEHTDKQQLYLKLSSLVVPGTGNLLSGATVRGVVVLFFWLFLIVMLVFGRHFAFQSFFEPGENTRALTLFYLLGMAVVYVIANISLFAKSQKAS